VESDASSVGSGPEESDRPRLQLHYAGDSDTGLESMSSADTALRCCSLEASTPTACSAPPSVTAAEAEILAQEVARLKCDKLDLLRHNVVSIKLQREV
jgi:hypothetical protein